MPVSDKADETTFPRTIVKIGFRERCQRSHNHIAQVVFIAIATVLQSDKRQRLGI